ncbi:hypothetical protein BDY24DRAFT_400004 [Mrakia frigida]|uniref:uncharacterized protein n=1 Tax=Mrakia frigida TaxID=29902 RepID=UPI003FCBF9B4
MPSSSSSSSKVALCPSSPPRTTPTTASSNASSGQNVEQPQADFLPFPPFSPPPPPPPAARRMPHLPLELQMIIIKDCIELYRQDEKINSSSSSSSGSGGGKKKQQASATAAATTRLAQIVGMELEVMEAEEREEIGTKATSWEVKGGGSGSVLATFVEGDRSPDEEVEERSRWGLALVSKTWNEISLPLLYRNIQLSQPSSYTILASLLTSPPSPFVPPVAKWIKRAVLREVPPTAWFDRESDVGKVIRSLQDLEIFKVRYRARVEGEEGVPVRERGQKEMWDVYPGVNPKVYHQHHLHTFTLPSITSAWPRLRQTSSDFMFCLTHPPPMVQKFPSLPLRSHRECSRLFPCLLRSLRSLFEPFEIETDLRFFVSLRSLRSSTQTSPSNSPEIQLDSTDSLDCFTDSDLLRTSVISWRRSDVDRPLW